MYVLQSDITRKIDDCIENLRKILDILVRCLYLTKWKCQEKYADELETVLGLVDKMNKLETTLSSMKCSQGKDKSSLVFFFFWHHHALLDELVHIHIVDAWSERKFKISSK